MHAAASAPVQASRTWCYGGWRTPCRLADSLRGKREVASRENPDGTVIIMDITLWGLFPCRLANSLRGKREVAGRENPDGTVTISRAAFDLLRLKDHAFDTVKEVGCGRRYRQLPSRPRPASCLALAAK
jgi:hypothetical protein